MLHKGTKAGNVAGGGRIVCDDQQRFAGLHSAYGFAHHHYRLRAAEALGWTKQPIAARIAACLAKNGLPTGTDYTAEALAQAALADKKRAGDSITLVIPQRIGECELRKLPVSDLLPVIRAGLEA